MKIELISAKTSDAELVYKSWGSNRRNFTYLSATPQTSVRDAELYLANALKDGQSKVFHIRDLGSAKVVGIVKAKINGHKALVGYVVDEQFWGKGIATQALSEILLQLNKLEKIASAGLYTRIWATCAIDNPASHRVLEKCGFIKEGTLKNWIVYPAQGKKTHDNYAYVWQPNI